MIKERGSRKVEAAVIEDIRRALSRRPGIQATFRRPTTFSFKKPVEVLVFGDDLRVIAGVADQLAARLRQIDGLRDVESSSEPGNPEVVIEFDRERMAALGLDVGEVSRILRHKIHGEVVTRYKERDQQIDVRVRTSGAQELAVDQVGDLVVSQRDRTPVVLAAVAHLGLERGPARIERVDQQRAAVVSANLAGRDLGGVTEEIIGAIRQISIPPTVVIALGGQQEELAASYRSLAFAILLAIFLVYMVMASQFESLLHPFVILLTVPMGLMGAVWALAVTGTAVSVVVLIGTVMLAGIVVNNAIVLIDHVNQRRAAGLSKLAALAAGGRARLRPILMTTATTTIGLLPMALGLGEGAEIRAPLAIAVIGGLLCSTLLTLVVIPCLYDVLDRTN
jgi:HAE1 family hydrophobic/amphiphilic exporter-1